MAGKILRKQYAVIGFLEGLVDMMWTQEYENRPHNSVFADARRRLKDHILQFGCVLRSEGTLIWSDIEKIKKQTDALKEKHMPGGEFTPMLAVSFCIDLIVEQIHYTKGGKKRFFELLLDRVREFEYFFDPKREYDDPEGLDMAETYRWVAA